MLTALSRLHIHYLVNWFQFFKDNLGCFDCLKFQDTMVLCLPQPIQYTGCFKKAFHNCIPNVTVWRTLWKHLHFKVYKLSTVQDVEWWRVCTPWSLNVFVTWNTHCKACWNTLHYQWKSHWIVTIPSKTRYVLLHYGSENTVHVLWISLHKISIF
jgi:hypothetical protein